MAVLKPLVRANGRTRQLPAADSLAVPFSWLTGLPATLAGHGITDAASVVLGSAITGYGAGSNVALVGTDTLLAALGKLQGQVNARQAALGFTPVQQGGGTGQLNNKVYIGWNASNKLALTVDSTDLGAIALESAVPSLARSTAITGYVVGSNAALAATDTIVGAFGKVQGQLDAKQASLGYTPVNRAGDTGITGALRTTGELQSTSANAIRMVQGVRGVFVRNDQASTYFLITADNDQYGTWNSLRPLYFSNTTGRVTMENGLTVSASGIVVGGGGISSGNGTITVTNTNASGDGAAIDIVSSAKTGAAIQSYKWWNLGAPGYTAGLTLYAYPGSGGLAARMRVRDAGGFDFMDAGGVDRVLFSATGDVTAAGFGRFDKLGAGGITPGYPLDVYVSSAGRFLVRDGGSGIITIDAVNGANSAYATMRFNATNYSFAGGGQLVNAGSFVSEGSQAGVFIGARANARTYGWYSPDGNNGVSLNVSSVGDVYRIDNAGNRFGRDVYADRANGTGAIFLGGGTRYLFYNGANYQMPGANLEVNGATVGTSIAPPNSGGASWQGNGAGMGLIGNLYLNSSNNYILASNAGAWIRIPRVFVQSTDPGAQASDGDLWFW